MKTILVVDDEPKIAEVIKSYLEKSGYSAVCAHSGKSALDMLEKHAPSLVILDLMLPDISGEDICRKIRINSRIPIIMLTAKIREEDIINGFSLGADDYLTKPFSPRQLMARVEAVLRRSSDDMQITRQLCFRDGELVIDINQHKVFKHGKPVSLTPIEFNILVAMARYPLRSFTRDELIRIALRSDFDGYDRVIDTHIKNLRQKIEDNSRAPEYIVTIHGAGYIFGVK